MAEFVPSQMNDQLPSDETMDQERDSESVNEQTRCRSRERNVVHHRERAPGHSAPAPRRGCTDAIAGLVSKMQKVTVLQLTCV